MDSEAELERLLAVVEGRVVLDLADLVARPRWMRDAACREHPDVNFFPDRGESTGPAKMVCRGCLVLEECRQWALADPGPPHGIAGGWSAPERQALRRRHAA